MDSQLVDQSCRFCSNLADPNRIIYAPELYLHIFSGCEACRLLYSALVCFPELKERTVWLLFVLERVLYIRLLDVEKKNVAMLELYTDPGKPCKFPIIGPGRSVSTGWDVRTIRLARSWIDSCLDNHSICASKPNPELPTRLINIGKDEDDTRLVESKGQKGLYAALSHCWGESRPIQTTTATIQHHMKKIEFDGSSKTFADAVAVCRDLGIKYLWIDSLCIIQDDKADWAAEAGKMTDVYRNAKVTISADRARGASDGLFADSRLRSQLQVQHEIECRSSSSSRTTCLVHVRLRDLSRFDSQMLTHANKAPPTTELSSRAWVVQERLLSPRILHFFDEELAWSCRSISRCECKFDAGISEPSVFRNLKNDAATKVKTDYELQREWAGLVTKFSGKKLTYSSDRLPAISGLAGLVKEYTNARYLAGLWDFDVPYGLLWMSDHDRAGTSKITRFESNSTIPSWTWASVDGPVTYLERHRTQFEHRTRKPEVKPLLRYVDARITSTGHSQLVGVQQAIITISGQLLAVTYDHTRVVWRPHPRTYPGSPNYITQKIQDMSISDYLEPAIEPKVVFDVLSEHPSEDKPLEGDKNEYYFLRAGIYIVGGLFASETQENLCILLKRADSSCDRLAEHVVYQRIGLVLHGFHTRTVWAHQELTTIDLI